MYRLVNDGTLKVAEFEDKDLLYKVVEFKMKFYPRGWAKYDEAQPGSFKLVPPSSRMAELEDRFFTNFSLFPFFDHCLIFL